MAKTFTRTLLASAVALACFSAQAASTIIITSRDAPGVGFNDPTPVAPVGGNPGTTLGAQRWFVYQHVAKIWEQALDSPVPITVSAGWEPLSCTATGATLGSASSWNGWYNVPNGKPGIFYPQALANKLAGYDLSEGQPDDGTGYGNVDIKTQFNINLGNPGCLTGTPFYLGIDGNAGTAVNFVETLLHELGHGLGFSVFTTNTANGSRLGGIPSVWEEYMYDNTAGKTWLNMTNAERVASAINPLKLGWNGANSVAGASMLKPVAMVNVTSPVPGGSGSYDYVTATFGPTPPNSASWGTASSYQTQDGETGPGCDAFNAANAAAANGKVMVIPRGTCTFTVKVKNAQNAGAIGVIISNNQAGVPGMGGTDPTVVIPAVGVTQAQGDSLRNSIANASKYGSRSKPGIVTVAFATDAVRKSGSDIAGRPLLYTPNPRVPGSSVSHWDVTATPNLLMEPSINSDLGTVLVPPKDLTVPLLKDLGW
ncbi:PA domain-containing protein [Pseudoduganella sp. OTU4001]|uniref:PA domain-containing protein n=1 Tax=Pseudoduganella sp. OTU4001 TaxID=3043854 RepID=UPI00313D08EC